MSAAAFALTFLLLVCVFWSHFSVYGLQTQHSRPLEDRRIMRMINVNDHKHNDYAIALAVTTINVKKAAVGQQSSCSS